jgi:hypothetical protein
MQHLQLTCIWMLPLNSFYWNSRSVAFPSPSWALGVRLRNVWLPYRSQHADSIHFLITSVGSKDLIHLLLIKFQYLGTVTTTNGAQQTEVQHQAHKTDRISGRLNGTIWRNKYLRLEIKVTICKPLVSPGRGKFCRDTSKTEQLLETAEMNTLRKILGLDHVTNQDIR